MYLQGMSTISMDWIDLGFGSVFQTCLQDHPGNIRESHGNMAWQLWLQVKRLGCHDILVKRPLRGVNCAHWFNCNRQTHQVVDEFSSCLFLRPILLMTAESQRRTGELSAAAMFRQKLYQYHQVCAHIPCAFLFSMDELHKHSDFSDCILMSAGKFIGLALIIFDNCHCHRSLSNQWFASSLVAGEPS